MNSRGSRFAGTIVFSWLAAVFLLAGFSSRAVVPAQWNSIGPGGGGALFAPSFSPFNAGEIFLACDMSEVFHTTNFGANWNVTSFLQIQGGRLAIVQFTSNPSILYGIDFTSIDGADSVTPTRSGDGGNTWQRLPADPTDGGAFSLFADPNSTNRLIVSDYNTIYFSTNGGNSFTNKFSDTDGCYLAGAFFDGLNIYIGTSAGLVYSTNGGSSFSVAAVGGIPLGQTMFSFAGAKQGATTRFFCVTLGSGDVFPGLFIEENYLSYQKIYSLDWGQANWTTKTNGILSGDDPVFVAMAQNDISTAYVAGQKDSIDFPVLYRTVNGGTSWQSVLLITNNQNAFTGWAGWSGDRDWSYGAGALGLAVAPKDSSKVMYTDLGFAHLSTNGGTFWKQVYVNPADQNPTNSNTPKGHSYRGVGLENTSCWCVTWADSNHIVAGYSDIKGTISADGGNSWSFGYTGHSLNSMYYCVKQPVTGVLYAGTASVHDMYQSTHLTDSSIGNGSGMVLFSTNAGVTWLTMNNFGHPVIWLATDPNATNKLYASVIATNQSLAGIYVSANIQNGASATWQRLAAPPRTEGHPFNILVLKDGTLVCTYSGRRAGSPQAFTASSGVFVSTNGGTSWLDRSDPGMIYWTKDIVIDPHDAAQNTWYVCVFSGYGGLPNGLGGVYRTTNRGVSWMRINSLDRVTSCAFNPGNLNELFLTTETTGLWFSSNITSVSPAFSQVANYPFRQPERLFFNPYRSGELWVTSFGHGIMVGNTVTMTLPGTLKANAATLNQDGTFRLTAQLASPGVSYTLSASTNLQAWIAVATNSADSNGVVQFNDTNVHNFSRRFYRTSAQ